MAAALLETFDRSAQQGHVELLVAVEAARRGEPRATDDLLSECLPQVSAYLSRRGSTDPGGLANTVMIEFLRNLPRLEFSNTRQLWSYLNAMCRSRLTDERRRASREILVTDVPERLQDGLDDQVVDQIWVTGMLERLTDEQREVLELRFLSDYSIKDTAAQIGKSEAAVKGLQRRALRALFGAASLMAVVAAVVGSAVVFSDSGGGAEVSSNPSATAELSAPGPAGRSDGTVSQPLDRGAQQFSTPTSFLIPPLSDELFDRLPDDGLSVDDNTGPGRSTSLPASSGSSLPGGPFGAVEKNQQAASEPATTTTLDASERSTSTEAAPGSVTTTTTTTTTVAVSSSTVAQSGADSTPPDLMVNAPADGSTLLAADYVEPTCLASDPSGLVEPCVIRTVETGTVIGGRVLTTSARAVDNAGNSANFSSSFTVLDADQPSCGGLVATIVGTPDNDTIVGTAGDDVIVALGGNDEVDGDAGNDIICLGDGDDIALGGTGNDIIYGGAGNDWIVGHAGDDILYGDDGADVIHGMTGDDLIFGGDSDDLLSGHRGADRIHGEAGTDSLSGGAEDDILTGGSGLDHFNGGTGTDTVTDAGADESDSVLDVELGL